LEFRILGRLEVVEHGSQLPLGGARQRALLALLVLHRRQTISRDRLVEELWGERCPPTAAKTVQVYISRLRKVLGEGIVETHSGGYTLLVDAQHTDIDRFQALAADGRAALESGDARDAARLCTSALAEWHGAPLEEFAYEGFAGPAITELEDLTSAGAAALGTPFRAGSKFGTVQIFATIGA
jgi:DNA-binding SARP family transcriptional activator